MPELPEVETTVRYLRASLLGAKVRELRATEKGLSHFNLSLEKMNAQLADRELKNIERHGKWIIFDFEAQKVIGHLRMSGQYKVADTVLDHPHNRFQLVFSGGKVLNYLDLRRFGTFHLLKKGSTHATIAWLGPDAISPDFNDQYLIEKLQKLKKNIYSALLDQKVVAGLGNIYVNEALNLASIHPLTKACDLTSEQSKELVKQIKRLLHSAIEYEGTTLIDNLYQTPEGNSGNFARMLQVYGKHRDPNVKVLKIGNRSVFVRKDLPESA